MNFQGSPHSIVERRGFARQFGRAKHLKFLVPERSGQEPTAGAVSALKGAESIARLLRRSHIAYRLSPIAGRTAPRIAYRLSPSDPIERRRRRGREALRDSPGARNRAQGR